MKTNPWLFGSLLICLFGCPVALTAQANCEKLFEPVTEAIREANADTLANYFSETVTCDIAGVEQTYNKGKAKQVVGEFFQSAGTVKTFTIRHCSGKESLKYAIGNATTAAGLQYRITIFANVDAGKILVRQLRIEQQP